MKAMISFLATPVGFATITNTTAGPLAFMSHCNKTETMNPKTRRILIITIIPLFALLFVLPVIIVFPKSFKHLFWTPECVEKGIMAKVKLDAVAISKFKDYSNHNNNAIKFQDISTNSFLTIYFINEKSGFYDIIQEGDTVYKLPNNLEISIINKKIKSTLIYSCAE